MPVLSRHPNRGVVEAEWENLQAIPTCLITSCAAGGNAAANAIQEECERQSVLCSVVGIPKSVRIWQRPVRWHGAHVASSNRPLTGGVANADR